MNKLYNLILFAQGTNQLIIHNNALKALRYFLRGAMNGCTHAKAVIAFYFEFGVGGVSIMFDLSEQMYVSAAMNGSGFACARLTFLKTHGRRGIKINLAESEKWGKLSRRLGRSSIAWLELVARSGMLPAAEFCLGLCYYNGIVVAEDDSEAFGWCQSAAKKGLASAQNVLGNLLIEGAGCEVDEVQGVQWYLKSAEQREAAAIYNIGTLFERGKAGVYKDLQQAFDWYSRAAAYGSVNAQNVLGIFYEEGLAVTQDSFAAISWYSKAAINGHPHAQYNTARCFHDGFGAEQNDMLAFAWFEAAAAQNHSLSLLSTAICLEHGIGTQVNKTSALEYYERAVKTGSKEAKYRLQSEIAVRLLPIARTLFRVNRNNRFESQNRVQNLPVEIIEYIIKLLDSESVLSNAQLLRIFQYAKNENSSLKSRAEFIAMVKTAQIKKSCICKKCKSLKHLMTSLEYHS